VRGGADRRVMDGDLDDDVAFDGAGTADVARSM
jgi:hypothetical protein